ncbi:adenine-specific DNA-methyltransferase [Candidatus Termititenax persephonae]|uniref:Adenine-specific DNA-methyltransferase n=1 Tax=Candidatus Termititenax persephonae TaxID=2218525 RepID=A0A388TGC0_9BACT|nr:adenine-specific DNA-methyltransferase [Candidatus Termititenax persephonae]
MELYYPEKKTAKEILDNIPICDWPREISTKNILIKGENLTVLQKLRENYTNKIDLIYIDPPFSTSTTFTIGEKRVSTISMSNDDTVAYIDNLKGFAFIEFIRERLIIARELLSDVGSIYLHIDYKMGHYIKIIMDEVFGIENFRNDITRIKCNPKNFHRKAYGNIKDMILFYSKTNEVIWNEPKLPFNEKDKEKLFKKIDKNGRAYTTIPLHAPGETKNGATSGLFKGLKPPPGRHWRCAPRELAALDAVGLVEWSSNGNPRKIIYADEQAGKKRQDIWEFKDYQYPNYPTEKNIDLLKTIISASSSERSIVMDFFCGSGTTLVAAQELNRNWIGVDKSEQAIKATKKKLNKLETTFFSNYEYSYLEVKNNCEFKILNKC